MKQSPSKKNIKDLYHAEEENHPEEPLKGAAMSTLNTHGGAWSNRQGMWPISERRMIFSCKKEIVTQQWLENLSALLADVNCADEILQEIGGTNDMANGTIQNLSMSYEDSTRGL